MVRWVIDDDGEVPFLAPRLRNKLRVRTLLEEDRVLLRNLGFAGRDRKAQAQFSARRRRFPPVASAILGYWLKDRARPRLLLDILRAGRGIELRAPIDRGLARIEALTDAHRRDCFFRRQAATPNVFPAPAATPYLWKVPMEPRAILPRFEMCWSTKPAGQYLLVQPDMEGGRFVIEQTGAGLQSPIRGGPGRRLADRLRNTDTARWVSKNPCSCKAGRGSIMSKRRYWPRLGRFARRYDRLISPCSIAGTPCC